MNKMHDAKRWANSRRIANYLQDATVVPPPEGAPNHFEGHGKVGSETTGSGAAHSQEGAETRETPVSAENNPANPSRPKRRREAVNGRNRPRPAADHQRNA